MNRSSAENLIGCHVLAWTAANGSYVGKLTAVEGKPWRGTVLIEGVVAAAAHHDRSAPARRGFRVGESITVGGKSIKPTTELGFPTYLEALERELCDAKRLQEESTVSARCDWVYPALIRALENVVLAEKSRIQTGVWKVA
jgi:hypothetical protein